MPTGQLLKGTRSPTHLFVGTESSLIRLEPNRNTKSSDQESRPQGQQPSPLATDWKAVLSWNL
jgi:hypothetical protein